MSDGQGRDGGRRAARAGGLWPAALVALALTACEGQQMALPFGSDAAPEASQPKPEPATGQAAPPAAVQPAPPAEPETAALPPEPVIDDNPARILGLGPDQLIELLGAPELTRREPPAEIWQYRGETCVFDVFLYDDAGASRVTYLEARDDSAQRVAERGCLNQLLRARLAQPLG